MALSTQEYFSLTLNDSYITTEAPPLLLSPGNEIIDLVFIRILFIILYAIIFILGISGNALVVFIVLRNKAMQTITNIFITNLAFSDIMMCLLAVPFTPISAFLDDWMFGKALCRIVPMTLGTSVYVSTLTSMAIAVDRYFLIVHPFKARMKTQLCILLIVAIWMISISISMPLGIYQTVSTYPNPDGTESVICHENWPKNTARQFFAITSLILQYLVPCSIITLCYTEVSLKLHSRSISRKGMVSRTRLREEQDIRRKRRTNKMLIAMVAIFVCCWLPVNAVQIARDYFPGASKTSYFNLIFFISHIIAMSSTIYNPFLYAWMNDVFRKEFKSVLPCLFSSTELKLSLDTQTYTAVDTRMSQVPISPASTLQTPLTITAGNKQPELQIASLNNVKNLTCDPVLEDTDDQEAVNSDVESGFEPPTQEASV